MVAIVIFYVISNHLVSNAKNPTLCTKLIDTIAHPTAIIISSSNGIKIIPVIRNSSINCFGVFSIKIKAFSLHEPCLTITCSPAQTQTERCHPMETRPLNIREYARIQTFPDLRIHGINNLPISTNRQCCSS